MVEDKQEEYILEFDSIPSYEIPPLHEVWNWQGDKSVLPIKWAETINKLRGEGSITSSYLIENYIKKPQFEPDGFFFLTYRSKALGCALAWKEEEKDYYSLEYLAGSGANRKCSTNGNPQGTWIFFTSINEGNGRNGSTNKVLSLVQANYLIDFPLFNTPLDFRP